MTLKRRQGFPTNRRGPLNKNATAAAVGVIPSGQTGKTTNMGWGESIIHHD